MIVALVSVSNHFKRQALGDEPESGGVSHSVDIITYASILCMHVHLFIFHFHFAGIGKRQQHFIDVLSFSYSFCKTAIM